jgi:hypothetical protein
MAGDPKYLAWVRKQPCACQPCAARDIEANHSTVAPTYAPGERTPKQLPGRRGKGQKSADYYAFPLCSRHHGQFHRLTGAFAGWSGDELERWQNEQSAAYRALYEEETTGRGGSPATVAAVDTPGSSAGRRGDRSGLVALIQEVRETCAHYGLSRQVELDFTRIVRRAAGEGTF